MAMATMALGRAPATMLNSSALRVCSPRFASSFVGNAATPMSSARTLSGNSMQLLLSSSCWSQAVVRVRKLGLVVRAGKTSMACTKRSRSRKSRARTQGFRTRMSSPGGRNVLRRRRRKGRKVLVTQSFPSSGKRA